MSEVSTLTSQLSGFEFQRVSELSESATPSSVRCDRFNTKKIEQKIETGGTNSTSTPMLKFLMKRALFEPANAARHIEHCAEPVSLKANNAATNIKLNTKHLFQTVLIKAPPRLAVVAL